MRDREAILAAAVVDDVLGLVLLTVVSAVATGKAPPSRALVGSSASRSASSF
jgi:Kef-type K+ transport system membrane component KefB